LAPRRRLPLRQQSSGWWRDIFEARIDVGGRMIPMRIDAQRPQLALEYGGTVLKRFTSRILVNDDDNEVVFVS
jgi:hypothetical protein